MENRVTDHASGKPYNVGVPGEFQGRTYKKGDFWPTGFAQKNGRIPDGQVLEWVGWIGEDTERRYVRPAAKTTRSRL